MTGKEITLEQMLSRREARAHEQQKLLDTYHSAIISFTMNIPGPIKTNELILKAFMAGKNLLLGQLCNINAEINHISEIHQNTGDELLLSVKNISPDILKDLAVNIETSSPVGRLYDIDVINTEGNKLSRKEFRKCLICGKQAQECARSRTHTVEEMQRAIELLL